MPLVDFVVRADDVVPPLPDFVADRAAEPVFVEGRLAALLAGDPLVVELVVVERAPVPAVRSARCGLPACTWSEASSVATAAFSSASFASCFVAVSCWEARTRSALRRSFLAVLSCLL